MTDHTSCDQAGELKPPSTDEYMAVLMRATEDWKRQSERERSQRESEGTAYRNEIAQLKARLARARDALELIARYESFADTMQKIAREALGVGRGGDMERP